LNSASVAIVLKKSSDHATTDSVASADLLYGPFLHGQKNKLLFFFLAMIGLFVFVGAVRQVDFFLCSFVGVSSRSGIFLVPALAS
jgi:hypothetical protein